MAVYNRRGDLVLVQYKKGLGTDPFYAETEALLEALLYITQASQEGRFCVFTDCKVLLQAVHEKQTHNLPTWQSAETVTRCWMIQQNLGDRVSIQYTTRNALKTPHELANWARISGKEDTGTPIQCQIAHLEVEHRLDDSFFIME